MMPRTPGSAAVILAAVLAAMLGALALTVWEGVRAVDDTRAVRFSHASKRPSGNAWN